MHTQRIKNCITGSLGKDSKAWLDSELGASLSGGADSSGSSTPVSLFYPLTYYERLCMIEWNGESL